MTSQAKNHHHIFAEAATTSNVTISRWNPVRSPVR